MKAGLEGYFTRSRLALSLNPFKINALDQTAQIRVQEARWSMYAEDQIHLGPSLLLNVGSRISYLHTQQRVFTEPRIALRYDHPGSGTEAWAFRISLGRYRQFLNQFDVPTYNIRALLPSVRFWMPVDDALEPSEAYHYTGAFLWTPSQEWQFRIESYYKYQPNQLTLDYTRTIQQDRTLQISTNPSDILTRGKGKAYGFAIQVRKQTRSIRAQIQYDFGQARRKEEHRFGGRWLSAPWTSPHRLFTSIDWIPLQGLTLSGRWQFVSGRSWGFRQAYYDYLASDPETQIFGPIDFGVPEEHRLPIYTQLDVGVGYERMIGQIRLHSRFQIANVLDRKNITEWSLHYDDAAQAYERRGRPGYPFMPSISLQLSW